MLVGPGSHKLHKHLQWPCRGEQFINAGLGGRVICPCGHANAMHALSLAGPCDAHECQLSQGFEACDVALGFFGEAWPLLLDFLEVPSFCEPGDGASTDEPAPYAHDIALGAGICGCFACQHWLAS